MTSTESILNLDVVRADKFTFDLLGSDRSPLGQLDTEYDFPPRVRMDTSRSVFRTCTGLQVDAATLSDINTLTERIRPVMTLQNGVRFNLGVFMFGTDARKPYSWGVNWRPELFDETFIVEQPLDVTVGISTNQSIMSLVNRLVGEMNLPAVDLSGVPDALASSPITFLVGTSRNKAITALLGLLGAYPPYFNNDGVYTAKLAPGAGVGADFTYGFGATLIDGTATTTNSVYRAPNRYQVVGDNPSGAIVGIYDLPDSAPNSYAMTGRRVTDSRSMQGLPNASIANLAAYLNALTDRNSYVQADCATTADPRHDAFNIVELLGTRYQETAWEIECDSGGPMTHDLNALYDPGS